MPINVSFACFVFLLSLNWKTVERRSIWQLWIWRPNMLLLSMQWGILLLFYSFSGFHLLFNSTNIATRHTYTKDCFVVYLKSCCWYKINLKWWHVAGFWNSVIAIVVSNVKRHIRRLDWAFDPDSMLLKLGYVETSYNNFRFIFVPHFLF